MPETEHPSMLSPLFQTPMYTTNYNHKHGHGGHTGQQEPVTPPSSVNIISQGPLSGLSTPMSIYDTDPMALYAMKSQQLGAPLTSPTSNQPSVYSMGSAIASDGIGAPLTPGANSYGPGSRNRSYSAAQTPRTERSQLRLGLSPIDTELGRPRSYSSGVEWNRLAPPLFGQSSSNSLDSLAGPEGRSPPRSAFPIALPSPASGPGSPNVPLTPSFSSHAHTRQLMPLYAPSLGSAVSPPVSLAHSQHMMQSPAPTQQQTTTRPRSVSQSTPLQASLSTPSTPFVQRQSSMHEESKSRRRNTVSSTDKSSGLRRGGSLSRQSSNVSRSPDSANSTSSSAGSNSNASSVAQQSSQEAQFDILSADLSRIYALCRDQRGCRYLQRRLSERDPAICSIILEATVPHIESLMMDPFGNYFCQKLVEHCTEKQVTTILKACAPSLVEIAQNPHGTRALQKTLEALKTHEQVDLVVQALDGSVVQLIRDLNGNHVIQKLLLELDEYGTQFVYDSVCRSILEVGTHRHGCCVLQRCLDYSKPLNRHRLVTHIIEEAPDLVIDQFGNYVCQYVVDLAVPEYSSALIMRLLGNIPRLSMQKFASNVVEKCLRTAEPQLRKALVEEIAETDAMRQLLLDNYGNYVVQTALEASENEERQALVVAVQSQLSQTRSPYGRRILAKLKSIS